jgi:hypothetical protein
MQALLGSHTQTENDAGSYSPTWAERSRQEEEYGRLNDIDGRLDDYSPAIRRLTSDVLGVELGIDLQDLYGHAEQTTN